MRSFMYNLKQGSRQLWRNKGTSLTAILLITSMLVLVGVCFIITTNLNLFTEVVKQDYNEVEVFLLDDVTYDDVVLLMQKVEKQDGVVSVSYRSKKVALDILKERWGNNGYLLDTLGDNPLPQSLVVTVESLDYSAGVAEYCGKLPHTDDVQYYQQTVEVLNTVTNSVQKVALIMMAFFVLISIFLISNTVKLTVMARSEEIQIMKYIGATNWFIRGPFMMEGVLIGIIAAILATLFIGVGYYEFQLVYGKMIMSVVQSALVPNSIMILNSGIIFLAIGVSIGAWGSLVSMKRFLKV
ncbi:MAG: permease-like cell division protein FtsX [Clostridia bacterium]|nr:permease-like cell division protein FtsX [Clostridia bacterium]